MIRPVIWGIAATIGILIGIGAGQAIVRFLREVIDPWVETKLLGDSVRISATGRAYLDVKTLMKKQSFKDTVKALRSKS